MTPIAALPLLVQRGTARRLSQGFSHCPFDAKAALRRDRRTELVIWNVDEFVVITVRKPLAKAVILLSMLGYLRRRGWL